MREVYHPAHANHGYGMNVESWHETDVQPLTYGPKRWSIPFIALPAPDDVPGGSV